jgi:predicted transcriptional regulator
MTHHQIAKSIGVTQSSIWRIAAGITTGPKYWVMDSLRLLLGGKV